MWYFCDGANDVVRFDVPDDALVGSSTLGHVPSARYQGKRYGGWQAPTSGLRLAAQARLSGDYYPIGEDEAQQIVALIDASQDAEAKGKAVRYWFDGRDDLLRIEVPPGSTDFAGEATARYQGKLYGGWQPPRAGVNISAQALLSGAVNEDHVLRIIAQVDAAQAARAGE